MWEKPSSKKRDMYKREQEREEDLKKEIIPPKEEKKETRQSPPLKVVCRLVRSAPKKKPIHDLCMMFLSFGRKKAKSTYEMHPLDGEEISMMIDIFETCSKVPVSKLMTASSKTTEEKNRLKKE